MNDFLTWAPPRKRFLLPLGATVVLFAFYGPPPVSKAVAFAALVSAVLALALAIFNAAERADGRS